MTFEQRTWLEVLRKAGFKGKPDPEHLAILSKVFMKFGGSWEALVKGSSKDANLLKMVGRLYVERSKTEATE